jgi:outer membrane protein OmpA-like peptidoglycan-associated protein
MCSDCIARLLEKGTFPPGESAPDETKYSTWPLQAKLICQGKFAELREWQSARLRETRKRDINNSPPAGERLWSMSRLDRCLLFLALGLLLLALLSRYFAIEQHWCSAGTPGTPPVRAVVLKLSSDQLFEYDKSAITGAHRDIISTQLVNYFRHFQEVKINSISAHTDPIGTNEKNRSLARDRANAVLGLLLKDVASGGINISTSDDFKKNLDSDWGPGREDYPIWRQCFQSYYIGIPNRIPPADRPLLNLPDQGRILCSMATIETGANDGLYPACRRIPVLPNGSAKHTAEVAEGFRQMAECLAPMRHVTIQFTANPKIDSEAPKSDSMAQGGE